MTKEEFEKFENMTDHEWDLKDVADGRFPDIEHAEAVWKILEGIAKIEDSLDIFTMTESDKIINSKTVEQLDEFVTKMAEFTNYVENFKRIN